MSPLVHIAASGAIALLAVACVGEPEAMPEYEPEQSLAFQSSFGLAEGEIVVEGGDFRQGDNVLLVSAHAASGDVPLALVAHAFMPAHSHGTEPPVVSVAGDGFRVDRLLLFMAGRWEITLEFDVGGTTDEFVFAANVP